MHTVETVEVDEFCQNVDPYVAMAESGETVGITEDGRIVAYIVPATNESADG